MVRRPCLEEVGVLNESLQVSEDFELWLRIASRWDVAVAPEVLAVREKRREGLSLSTRPDKYLENGIAALKNVESVRDRLAATEARALQEAIAERYYVYGSYLLAGGLRTESREKLLQALRRWPAHGRAWVTYALIFLSASSSRRLIERHHRLVRDEN